LKTAGHAVTHQVYDGVTHELSGMDAVVATAKDTQDFAVTQLEKQLGTAGKIARRNLARDAPRTYAACVAGSLQACLEIAPTNDDDCDTTKARGNAMPATTASNLDIAKQANAHARADFATWQMMAKLRSTSALPQDAQDFYAGYLKLLDKPKTTTDEAAETTIRLVYKAYYAKMGGTGTPPRIETAPIATIVETKSPTNNVTPFRKIKPEPKPAARAEAKPRLPVALIFVALCAIVVTIRMML
jgi:hypothetical protein